MNTQIHFDQNLLLYFYVKYKQYLLTLGSILLCVCVFIFFVIPQIQTYFSNSDSLKADEQTLSTIQENISTLSLLQESGLQNNILITTSALPKDKDFTGILNAISQAAQIANVGLGDYAFQVGDIFGKNAPLQNGQLTIQISLSLVGDLPATKRFIDTLSKEFPLSEVTALQTHGDTGAELTALFFYKPFSQANIIATAPLPKLSLPQQKLLRSLSTDFEKPADTTLPKRTTATESAQTQQ